MCDEEVSEGRNIQWPNEPICAQPHGGNDVESDSETVESRNRRGAKCRRVLVRIEPRAARRSLYKTRLIGKNSTEVNCAPFSD